MVWAVASGAIGPYICQRQVLAGVRSQNLLAARRRWASVERGHHKVRLLCRHNFCSEHLNAVQGHVFGVGLHLLRAGVVGVKDDPAWKDDGWPMSRVCSARHGMPCWCRPRHAQPLGGRCRGATHVVPRLARAARRAAQPSHKVYQSVHAKGLL